MPCAAEHSSTIHRWYQVPDIDVGISVGQGNRCQAGYGVDMAGDGLVDDRGRTGVPADKESHRAARQVVWVAVCIGERKVEGEVFALNYGDSAWGHMTSY